MSLAALPVYPAQDILLVDLGERWARGEFEFVQFAPTQSDGTRVFVRLKDGGPVWFRVTDLLSFKIARLGQTLVTILINQVTATATATISPALEDATLTNWRVIGSARQTSIPAAAYTASFSFTSISQLLVRAMRPLTQASSAVTGTTIDVSLADLIDVDVLVNNPHGSDVGVGPHGHTIAPHTIVDPGHVHALINSLAQVVVTIDWIILHV